MIKLSIYFSHPNRLFPFIQEMDTHSSILAWRIPWTEEPGRLQSMGSLGVGHKWATKRLPIIQQAPVCYCQLLWCSNCLRCHHWNPSRCLCLCDSLPSLFDNFFIIQNAKMLWTYLVISIQSWSQPFLQGKKIPSLFLYRNQNLSPKSKIWSPKQTLTWSPNRA